MDIKNALTLDMKEPLSKAISELTDTGTAVIITKGGRYLGVVDDRSLGYTFTDASTTRCETVIAKPPTLLPTASMLERIDAFLLGHFKALPVVNEDGKAVGITTRVELMDDMLKERVIPKSKVSELMNAPVYTIDEEDTVATAKSLMKKNRCSRLVVVRNTKPVGVISTLDLAAKRAFHRSVSQKKPIGVGEVKSIDKMPITEFFRPDITSVGEADTVEEAAKRMIKKSVSSVVVIAKHKPVGVLSAVDLFRIIQGLVRDDGEELVISGLGEDNMGMWPHIKSKIGGVLQKFSSSFRIRNAKVHVKENKSLFDVKIYFDTNDGHVSLAGEGNKLKETIDELSQELDGVLAKRKDKKKMKQRKTHFMRKR